MTEEELAKAMARRLAALEEIEDARGVPAR